MLDPPKPYLLVVSVYVTKVNGNDFFFTCDCDFFHANENDEKSNTTKRIHLNN